MCVCYVIFVVSLPYTFRMELLECNNNSVVSHLQKQHVLYSYWLKAQAIISYARFTNNSHLSIVYFVLTSHNLIINQLAPTKAHGIARVIRGKMECGVFTMDVHSSRSPSSRNFLH